MPKARTAPDMWMIGAVMLILAAGLVMVYSSSAVLALREYGDVFYYLKRQLLFAALGIGMMIFMAGIDYRVLRKYAPAVLVACFALLVIVLIPGVGVVRGGARSWLGIGSFGIQPSEFMKLAMVVFMAKHLADRQQEIAGFARGLLPPLAIMGCAFGLIMLQPDLGSGAVMVGATMLVIYAPGPAAPSRRAGRDRRRRACRSHYRGAVPDEADYRLP
jgi:Bacterial cell division membrane protein